MADKKKESTLRCVTVLTVIAVICGVLLAVLNPLLYVAPTADDISGQFTIAAEGAGEWTLEDLDSDLAGKTSDSSGAAVTLVAKMTATDETYYGLLIKTKASGNLSECTFVMFFTASDNKLVDAKMSVDGSSGGKYSYDSASAQTDSSGNKPKAFEDYYVVITSATQFDDDYTVPRVGATLTLTAVNNAFKKAAYYYYNAYVAKGE